MNNCKITEDKKTTEVLPETEASVWEMVEAVASCENDSSGVRNRKPCDKKTNDENLSKLTTSSCHDSKIQKPSLISLSNRCEPDSTTTTVMSSGDEATPAASEDSAEQKKKHQGKGSWTRRRPRVSRMDTVDPESQICKSEFRGFVNLFYIFGMLYMLVNPVYKFYETGIFIDSSLAHRMFEDFFILMTAWAGCTLWSFNAFALFRLYISQKISRPVLVTVQYLTQISLVTFCVTLILYKKWAVFPSFFICVIGAIYSMKMHSYVSSCLDFHENGPPEHASDCFPDVLTVSNFMYFLVAPVLVYEIFYPRTEKFRYWYFISKLNHMGVTFMMMYLVVSYSVVPIVSESYKHSFVHTVARLVGPLLVMDFLCFYFLFECICNLLAEVTRFADRDFYEDWWNSTNWDEYARKWNKPVHQFLSRHVYFESHKKLHLSKRGSTLVTFFFSAIIHETILAVTFRLPRYYILVLMLFQLPLIQLGNWINKKSEFKGNLLFWFGIIVGVPFLGVCYGRELSAVWAGTHSDFEALRIF